MTHMAKVSVIRMVSATDKISLQMPFCVVGWLGIGVGKRKARGEINFLLPTIHRSLRIF